MPRERTAEEIQRFRDRLCASFTKLFAERGYQAVTMRALAEDAGCSPMTPYRYFKDKAEILAAARAAGFRALSDRIEADCSAINDPVENCRLAAVAFVDFYRSAPDTYRLMYTNFQQDMNEHPELEQEIARARRVLAELAERIPQVQASGMRPAAVAQTIWAALHGVIQIHMNDAFDESTTLDEVFTILVTMLAAGGQAVFGLERPPDSKV